MGIWKHHHLSNLINDIYNSDNYKYHYHLLIIYQILDCGLLVLDMDWKCLCNQNSDQSSIRLLMVTQLVMEGVQIQRAVRPRITTLYPDIGGPKIQISQAPYCNTPWDGSWDSPDFCHNSGSSLMNLPCLPGFDAFPLGLLFITLLMPASPLSGLEELSQVCSGSCSLWALSLV